MKLAATPTYSPYIDLEVTFFVREDLRGKTAFTFAVLSYIILEILKKKHSFGNICGCFLVCFF